MRRLRISVLVALVGVFGSMAYAQEGTITGTVTDDTKAVLPGAAVTATDQETGRLMVATTNDKGEYGCCRCCPGDTRFRRSSPASQPSC